MMNSRISIVAAGVFLISSAAVIYFSPDDDLILSPGFERISEKGLMGNEVKVNSSVFGLQSSCSNEIIFRDQNPNHKVVLTDDFKGKSIKAIIEKSDINPNVVIIIQPAGKPEMAVCHDYYDDNGETILSYEYFPDGIVPAGTYLVWIGDTIRDSKPTPYKIQITEENKEN